MFNTLAITINQITFNVFILNILNCCKNQLLKVNINFLHNNKINTDFQHYNNLFSLFLNTIKHWITRAFNAKNTAHIHNEKTQTTTAGNCCLIVLLFIFENTKPQTGR
jgi:hypothetical protein